MTAAIHACLEGWHRFMKHTLARDRNDPDLSALEHLIDDECIFYSPVVFTPQRGGEITRMYLAAATRTLGGNEAAPFRYTREIASGNHAMLEFETSVNGKTVNGVDIITCNEEGRIVEFKVMVRPLQGITAVHDAMLAMLAGMTGEPTKP